jgi:hypothetical protein
MTNLTKLKNLSNLKRSLSITKFENLKWSISHNWCCLALLSPLKQMPRDVKDFFWFLCEEDRLHDSFFVLGPKCNYTLTNNKKIETPHKRPHASRILSSRRWWDWRQLARHCLIQKNTQRDSNHAKGSGVTAWPPSSPNKHLAWLQSLWSVWHNYLAPFWPRETFVTTSVMSVHLAQLPDPLLDQRILWRNY